MTLSMLQNILGNAVSARRFNVPHTAILWLRHRLQEIGITRNHSRSGLPPATALSKDWHNRPKHLWDHWRLSTRTAADTTGRHNVRISAMTMRHNLRRFYTACATSIWRPRPQKAVACCKAPLGNGTMPFISQSASHMTSLHQMPSIHCPGQRTRRPAPHRSANDLTDCQIRSLNPPPETMVQLCLVIHEVWDDISQARITHLGPFLPRRCRVVHEAHGMPKPLLTLLHLTACCTEQNASINFCLANDDSRHIADLTHSEHFLWAAFIFVKFPIENDVRFFLCSVFVNNDASQIV